MTTDHFLTDCPSCGSQNRVPTGRVGQAARCGRCKTALATDQVYAEAPVELTEGTFDIVTRHSALPVLVDFWAAWCAPCRQLAPILEELAVDLRRRLLVGKLDTEQAQITAARFGIQAIPTLVLLRRGIEVARIQGLQPLAALKARVEPYLGSLERESPRTER